MFSFENPQFKKKSNLKIEVGIMKLIYYCFSRMGLVLESLREPNPMVLRKSENCPTLVYVALLGLNMFLCESSLFHSTKKWSCAKPHSIRCNDML
jgi:hypothetical protein